LKRTSLFVLLTLSLVLTLSTQSAMSQDVKKRTSFLSVNAHAGSNYYPGGELEDELEGGYTGLDFRYGWQSYEEDHWSAVFNYANYGVGYWVGDIGDEAVFGTPMALYGFINFPIYRAKSIELSLGPAFGLGFNLEPFDPVTNAQNDLTGGQYAGYLNFNIGAAVKLTESLDLSIGGDFIHMSNGGIKQPNTGFDMYGGHLGLRFHIDRRKIFPEASYNTMLPEKREKDKTRKSQVNIFQAIGVDQKLEDQGTDIDYTVATTTLEYQFRFNEIHGMTAGLNLFYDSSVKTDELYPEYETTLFPGVHVGYDLHFWRLAIRPQLGYLVTEAGQNLKAGLFARLALSADLTNKLYFMMAVKSINGLKADWADFGLGLHLFQRTH
jgi:hypothetical protein